MPVVGMAAKAAVIDGYSVPATSVKISADVELESVIFPVLAGAEIVSRVASADTLTVPSPLLEPELPT